MSGPIIFRAVLVLLGTMAAPAAARAGISGIRAHAGDAYESPSTSAPLDVFVPNDEMAFTLAPSQASGCTLTDDAGGSRTLTMTSSGGLYTGGSYTVQATDDGLFTLTCGTSSVEFYAGDYHRRLFLDHTEDAAGVRLYDVVSEYDSSGVTYSEFTTAPSLLPGFTTSTDWTHGTAWDYVLFNALPTAEESGGTALPTPGSASSATASITASGVLTSSDAGEARTFLTWSERVALAYVASKVADEEGLTSPGTGDPLASTNPNYLTAAYTWGDAAVAASPWSTAWPTSDGDADVVRSEWLIGMCTLYDWTYDSLDLGARRDWRAVIVAEANDLYADYIDAPTSRNSAADIIAGSDPSTTKRTMRNTHHLDPYVAVAVAANTLHMEYPGATDDQDDWLDDAEAVLAIAMSWLGDDGGDTVGVYYDEVTTEFLLRFVESQRTREHLPSAHARYLAPGDVEADWYDTFPWFAEHPEYLLRMTRPDSRRSEQADGYVKDSNGPSDSLALLARVTSDPLAQRLAWLGHNDWTSYDSSNIYTKRDVLDVVWWNQGGTLTDDTALAAEPTHRCFPDAGLVTLRSSWDDDATQLVFRTGGLVGGHDSFPGSYELAYEGALITADGYNTVSKRAAASSILLLDGYGPHGDGRNMFPAPLRKGTSSSAANSSLIAYLDAKGEAADGTDIDVVAFATDLAPLYTQRSGTINEGYTGYTNVESGGTTLDELTRYVLWVGDPDPDTGGVGGMFVFDRLQSSAGSFDFRWLQQSAQYDTTPIHGSVEERRSCAVPSSGGKYRFEDATGATVYLKFDGTTSSPPWWSCAAGTASCPSDAVTAVAQGEFTPDDSASACNPSGLLTLASGSHGGFVEPAGQDGKLHVTALESATATLSIAPTATLDGGTVRAYHFARDQAGATDASFLTVLRPYDAVNPVAPFVLAGPPPPGTITGAKDVVLGVKGGATYYKVRGYFTDPGSSLLVESITCTLPCVSYTTQLDGPMAVVAHADGDPLRLYAMQLVNGRKFTYRDRVHLESADASGVNTDASVSVNYGGDEIWGTIQDADGYVFVDLTPVWPTPLLHTYTASIDGVGVTSTRIGDRLRISIIGSGVLSIIDNTYSGTPIEPHSHCAH